jgi:hypothetical protein
MNNELEEQIDELFNKTMKDLKSKISRLVIKNQTKVLKEQAKDIKSGLTTRKSLISTLPTKNNSSKESSNKKYHNRKHDRDSESDSNGFSD